jgi:hypothetical protein
LWERKPELVQAEGEGERMFLKNRTGYRYKGRREFSRLPFVFSEMFDIPYWLGKNLIVGAGFEPARPEQLYYNKRCKPNNKLLIAEV